MQKCKSSRIIAILLYTHSANVNLMGVVALFRRTDYDPYGFGITSEPKPSGSSSSSPNLREIMLGRIWRPNQARVRQVF
jgi:hypothetical protein